MSLYADDLMLYRPIYSATDYTICYKYNRCVWSDNNLLKFIDRKCKYMIRHLSPEESNPPSLYTSQDYSKHVWRAGTLLQESGLLPPWISLWKSVKYAKQARQQVSILYRKFYPSANTSSLLQLYLAYIHPHVEYAPVWTPTNRDLSTPWRECSSLHLRSAPKLEFWIWVFASVIQPAHPCQWMMLPETVPTLSSCQWTSELHPLYHETCPDLSETPLR